MGAAEPTQKRGQEQKRCTNPATCRRACSSLGDTRRTHLPPRLLVFARLTSTIPWLGAPYFTAPKQELATDVSLPCHLPPHEFRLDQEGQVRHWHLWDPVRETTATKNQAQLTVLSPSCGWDRSPFMWLGQVTPSPAPVHHRGQPPWQSAPAFGWVFQSNITSVTADRVMLPGGSAVRWLHFSQFHWGVVSGGENSSGSEEEETGESPVGKGGGVP